MRARPRQLLMALGVLGLLSCKHARPGGPPEEPPIAASGRVGFKFIADPKAALPHLTDHQELVVPDVIGKLVLPEYPHAPLEAQAAPASVVLRIVIGLEGHVVDVLDSPLMLSTPSPFAAEFRASAETAVRRWRFTPGRIDQYEDGQDVDGDGKPDSTHIVRSDTIRVFYDVRFDFEIVRGEGRVRSSATP